MKQQASTERGAFPAQLGAEQQYRRLLLTFPHLTQEREDALIERALANEDVRNDLILSLQPRVYTLASHLACKYLRGKERATEPMDMVQKANEALLKRFSRALTKENPCSYLLKVARLSMIDCIREMETSQQQCNERDGALLDPFAGEGVCALIQAIPAEGCLVPPGEESAVSGVLYQAIGVLPEKQRLVMVRHYGLGCAPESLNVISRRLFPRSPRNAHYHHRRALVVLKRTLGPAFPRLGRAAGGAR